MKFETTDAKKIIVYDIRTFAQTKTKNSIKKLENFGERKPLSVFEEPGIDPSRPIREQEPAPLPDRAELDNIIFDEIGLSEDERKEVYWSVCELVKQRLDKAGSLKKKK